MIRHQQLIVPAIAAAALLLIGCKTNVPVAGPSPKSALFTASSDLGAVVARVAKGDDYVVADKQPFGSSGDGDHTQHFTGFTCTIRCRPAATDALLKALRSEIEKLATDNGAEITGRKDYKGLEMKKDDPPESARLSGFVVHYKDKAARVQVANFEVHLTPLPDEGEATGTKRYHLRIDLHEFVIPK
jgi:hypothetical protein